MPIIPQENLPTLSVNSVIDKYSMFDDGITKFSHIIDKQEYGVLKHVMNDMSKRARKRPLSDLVGDHRAEANLSSLNTSNSTNRSPSKNVLHGSPLNVNSRSKSPDLKKKKKSMQQRMHVEFNESTNSLSRQLKSPKDEAELSNGVLSNGFPSPSAEAAKKKRSTPSTSPRRLQRTRNDSSKGSSPVGSPTVNNKRPSIVKTSKKPISKHVSFDAGRSDSPNDVESKEDIEHLLYSVGPMTAFKPNFDLERPGSSDSAGSEDETLPEFVTLKVPKYEEKPAEDDSNAKNKKKSSAQNSAYNEIYDRAPIGAMRIAHQFPAKREKFLRENTSKWFVRWTGAVQVPNSKKKPSNILYTSSFEKIFRPSDVPRKFKLPDALISVPKGKTAGNQRSETVRPISYEMDEMDQLWIDSENFKRVNSGMDIVHPSDFLKIMNTLETDVYLNTTKVLLEQVGFSRCFFDDPDSVACDICYMPECESDDNIVFCDGCETVVHQSCYGLNEVPTGSWLCDVCLMESTKPRCLMCPLPHGAMKKTSCASGYIHIACALWIDDVTFEDAARREGINIYAKKKPKREHGVCQVCNIFEGAHLFCSKEGCQSSYHVTCAQRAGYRFQVNSNSEDSVKFISYCRKHTMETLPRNTTVTNRFVRSRPPVTAQDLEKTIMLYTEAETNPALKDINSDIITDVFEYWKLKRFDKGGPLISPAVVSVNYLPLFKEIVTKPNNVRLRSEPSETRMATDKARTLMWMVQDRENKKLEILNKIKEQTFEIVDKCTNEEELEDAIRSLEDFIVEKDTNFTSQPSRSSIGYNVNDIKGPKLEFDTESYIEKKVRVPRKVSSPPPRIHEVDPEEIERFDFKTGEKKVEEESIQYEVDEREFRSFTDKYGRIALDGPGAKSKNSDRINVSEFVDHDDVAEESDSYDFTQTINIAVARSDDNEAD